MKKGEFSGTKKQGVRAPKKVQNFPAKCNKVQQSREKCNKVQENAIKCNKVQ